MERIKDGGSSAGYLLKGRDGSMLHCLCTASFFAQSLSVCQESEQKMYCYFKISAPPPQSNLTFQLRNLNIFQTSIII